MPVLLGLHAVSANIFFTMSVYRGRFVLLFDEFPVPINIKLTKSIRTRGYEVTYNVRNIDLTHDVRPCHLLEAYKVIFEAFKEYYCTRCPRKPVDMKGCVLEPSANILGSVMVGSETTKVLMLFQAAIYFRTKIWPSVGPATVMPSQ